MGFTEVMGIQFTVDTPDVGEGVMPITDDLRQPFGLVHGGATIALLETVASRAAELRADLEVEQPFGITIEVRHHKSGVAGKVTGVASFTYEEPCRGGVKQYWDVVAYDDAGDIMTGGTIMTKTLLKSYLEEKRQGN